MRINFAFTGKVYDALKWIALILLPAIGTFYFTMAGTWSLPYATEVVGTIAAIDAFLGVLLGIAEIQYRMFNTYALNTAIGNVSSDSVDVGFVLSDETYDVLKWIAQVLLPAAATLYFTLSKIWGLPMAEQVVSTIMAFDTLLGMLLQFSASQFNKKAAFSFLSE